jgi:hypothetical protein
MKSTIPPALAAAVAATLALIKSRLEIPFFSFSLLLISLSSSWRVCF